MHNRQQSRRHTTHRLLLLAGATIGISAAIGLSWGDDAQAAERDPALADATAAVPSVVTTATSASPRPARDLVDRPRDTATATRAVRHVTGKADTAARHLRAVGRTVDKATDLASHVSAPAATTSPPAPLPPTPPAIDSTTPSTAPPLTPPTVDVTIPPTVDGGAPAGQEPAGTLPAPELTTGAPTPPTVGSGAATPSRPALGPRQHQSGPTGGPTPSRTYFADPQQARVRPAPAGGRAQFAGFGDGHARPAAVNASHHLDGITGDRSALPRTTTRQLPTGHHRDHTGRSWPPSAPAG